MADVPGKFFSARKVRTGVSPSSPGSLVGESVDPVNPPGTSLTSVGLTMPTAFAVANSPLTSNGTIAVTGAGTVAQYVRGDGTLADFPESSGGGSSVSYYLNGSVSQGTIGGVAYLEMNKVPILGAGTDFTIAADGYIASFITDAGDPNLLEIPGGNWNFESYFSASSGGGSPTFYVELYKVNAGGTATLIASSSAIPELIAFGTNITPYFSSLAVPTTVLALTDRLAVRYYVTHSGRTITLHTEGPHLCQIITTFTTGLTSLNGLNAQVQFFAVGTSGTDFNIASATATHTFNLPTASATNRGALSSADWSTFNSKQNALTNPVTGTGSAGQVAYWSSGSAITGESNLFWDATNDRLGIGTSTPKSKLEVFGSTKTALNIVNSEILISSLSQAENYFAVDGNIANISYNGTSIGLSGLSGFATEAYFVLGGFRTVLPRGWTGIISLTATANNVSLGTSVKIETSTDGSSFTTRATALVNETLTYNETTPLGSAAFLRIKLESTSGSPVSETACRFSDLFVSNLFAEINNTFSSGVKYPDLNNVGIYTSGIERIRIFSDGKVFIGSSPSNSGFQLDVNGTGRFTGNLTANSFIKSGGTSSQFLKADGSVDSTTYVPVGRTITINGTTQDLSADRTFNVGTVTSVTASSPLFSSGGTTPNITIQQASGSQNGFLSSTDWTTFNNKAPSVVGGYLPLSGGTLTGTTTMQGSTASLVLKSDVAGVPLYLWARSSDNSSAIFFMDNTGNTVQNWIQSLSTEFRIISEQNIPINFRTNNVGSGLTRMSITGAGNVGIGENNPTEQLVLKRGTYPTIKLIESTDNASAYFQYHSEANEFRLLTISSHPLIFSTTDTERMRITSGGNVLIGTTTDNGAKLQVSGAAIMGKSGNQALILRNGTTADRFQFYVGDGTSGSVADENYILNNNTDLNVLNNGGGVQLINGATSWTSISDEKTKVMSEFKPFENSIQKIITLRSGTSRYKTDSNNISRSFLIAQDVQKVLPEAISINKNGELGLRYTELIPLLVSAIKELKEEIDTLKN
jgi:hypothetical protein